MVLQVIHRIISKVKRKWIMVLRLKGNRTWLLNMYIASMLAINDVSAGKRNALLATIIEGIVFINAPTLCTRICNLV
jgi:hypothetical protein